MGRVRARGDPGNAGAPVDSARTVGPGGAGGRDLARRRLLVRRGLERRARLLVGACPRHRRRAAAGDRGSHRRDRARRHPCGRRRADRASRARRLRPARPARSARGGADAVRRPGGRRQRRKPGEDRKPLSFDDLYLDVGARDGEDARSLVRPGDAAVIAGAPLELRNNRIAARSLDNRIGAYVALEAARRIAADGGAPGPVAGLAAVQEEVGDFAGARTAAFELEPAVAVAVDVTHATDVRGGDPEKEGEHKLGSGVAIMRGPAIHPQVFDLLYETAQAEEIPFTVEVSRGRTNTDADAMYLSRHGVATGLLSIPLRYMHTPVETVELDDVEAVVRRLVAFARRLEPGT